MCFLLHNTWFLFHNIYVFYSSEAILFPAYVKDANLFKNWFVWKLFDSLIHLEKILNLNDTCYFWRTNSVSNFIVYWYMSFCVHSPSYLRMVYKLIGCLPLVINNFSWEYLPLFWIYLQDFKINEQL